MNGPLNEINKIFLAITPICLRRSLLAAINQGLQARRLVSDPKPTATKALCAAPNAA
jgi:hypothetical protein